MKPCRECRALPRLNSVIVKSLVMCHLASVVGVVYQSIHAFLYDLNFLKQLLLSQCVAVPSVL